MKSSTWSRVLPPLVTVAALLVIWQVVTVVREVPPLVLPPPTMIVEGIVAEFPRLLSNAGYTLSVLGLGYAVGVSIGLLLAVLVTAVPILRSALYPLAVASQSIPKIAIAPLLLIWFGIGITPKIVIVALLAFFPVFINSVAGLDGTDRQQLELLRSVNANRWQTYRHVRVPAAIPYIFAGLKLALTVSVIGAVVSEWVSGNQGLGYLLIAYNAGLRTDMVFATLTVLVALSMTLFALITLIEKRLSWEARLLRSTTNTAVSQPNGPAGGGGTT